MLTICILFASLARAAPLPAPAPAPAPEEPAAAPAPIAARPVTAAVEDIEAIHRLISSERKVKKCFVPIVEAGALPLRVDVMFRIETSGSATGTTIQQAEYKDTELDRCLSRVIGAIRFPPRSASTSISYPFLLE